MSRAEPVARDAVIAAPARRYTLDGGPAVEARIAADQQRIAAAVTEFVPAATFVALVLMGGYGRGEGGYVSTDHGPAPCNDYDYFVVIQRTAGAERAALHRRLGALAETLTAAVGVEVDFALLAAEHFKRAEYSLMNAEMRWGHHVVAGAPDVLQGMRDMPFRGLPHGELTRLMLNRGALLLMDQQCLLERRSLGAGGGLDARERAIFFRYLFKAVLACGDARLAAMGQYHPSYPEKLARLQAPPPDLSGSDRQHPDPMPRHEAFLQLYRLAYRHKFHPAYDEFSEARPADWLARVVRQWTTTLRAFEHHRLGRSFADWRAYCRPDLPKGQGGPVLRNIGANARDFGTRELLRRPRRALRHPRERLIAALPLLLTGPGSLLDPCAATALGLPPNIRWKLAAERFLALWARYA